ncbi:MAG: MFS transporter [Rhodospirillaceae bacterium]|nr:MFS transporter [Rhodospirillaceae bacterium]
MAGGGFVGGGPKAPPDPSGLKIGPFWFTPGIKPVNVITCLFAVGSALAMMTFMNFVQPYVLTDILSIPREQQGKLTGSLAGMQEVVVILLMGFVGALSDKVGRRIIFASGFIVLGLGYILYPTADDVMQLYIYRILFAVGTAMIPVMMSACIQDYSQDVSRGKWVGLTSVFNGLGVSMMALTLSRLPSIIQARYGTTEADAVIYSFWVMGGISIVIGFVVFAGLAKVTGAARQREPILKLIREGLRCARENPKIALSYYSAVATRGDVVIVGTYFTAWFVAVGAEQGMSTGEAIGPARFLFGVAITFSALAFAFFQGWICDKVNRVTGMIIAFALSTLGYGFMGMIGDPFHSFWIIPVCILLGCGETANVVAGGALIGQEAPARIRGSILGVFNLFGAIGIAVCVGLGGWLFDHWYYNAPFMMMGIINASVLLLAIYVRIKHGEPTPRTAEAPQPQAQPAQ